jgi:short-subunit dehydrogenase
MAGMGGVPYLGAYTATKAAVVALSESWAGELEEDGIHVSVLCPAFVKTRIHESERNRPKKYQSVASNSSGESSFANTTKQMVENGMELSIVGKRVVEALKDGEFYIFTHPNYHPFMQERNAAINAAFQKASQSPLLKDIVNQKIEMP